MLDTTHKPPCEASYFQREVLKWPNLITAGRIVLTVGMFYFAGNPKLIFWLAFAAWVSDGVDGWLAKTFGWCTRFGARFDQWADWLFGFALLYALCVAEPLTRYNTPLVLSIAGYLIARIWYLEEDTTGRCKAIGKKNNTVYTVQTIGSTHCGRAELFCVRTSLCPESDLH